MGVETPRKQLPGFCRDDDHLESFLGSLGVLKGFGGDPQDR